MLFFLFIIIYCLIVGCTLHSGSFSHTVYRKQLYGIRLPPIDSCRGQEGPTLSCLLCMQLLEKHSKLTIWRLPSQRSLYLRQWPSLVCTHNTLSHVTPGKILPLSVSGVVITLLAFVYCINSQPLLRICFSSKATEQNELEKFSQSIIFIQTSL